MEGTFGGDVELLGGDGLVLVRIVSSHSHASRFCPNKTLDSCASTYDVRRD
jgi:hypothetical protein